MKKGLLMHKYLILNLKPCIFRNFHFNNACIEIMINLAKLCNTKM